VTNLNIATDRTWKQSTCWKYNQWSDWKKNLLAHSFYRKSDTKVKLKIWC